MNKKLRIWTIASWIISMIFLILGILNALLIHPVPGLFYILVAIIYFPPLNAIAEKKLGLTVPIILKIIIAVVIMWATLGVGDLMELFESKFLGS